jgi:hypothetical protein
MRDPGPQIVSPGASGRWRGHRRVNRGRCTGSSVEGRTGRCRNDTWLELSTRRRQTRRSEAGRDILWRSSGNHRASVDLRRRAPSMAHACNQAARGWLDTKVASERPEPLRALGGKPHRCRPPLAEAMTINGNHCVPDVQILKSVDVLHVHLCPGLDHHVVHDVPPAPATPGRMPQESRSSPPRNHRLPEPERDPPDDRAARGGDVVGEECNEGGRVCGRGDDGARHPGPCAMDRDPTTVVEGRPAPWRVVNPGPAVGRVIGPLSGTVRSPIRPHVLRNPGMSVLGGVLPRAELLEIFGAGDIRRNVLHTGRRLRLGGQRNGRNRWSDRRRFGGSWLGCGRPIRRRGRVCSI